MILPHPESDLTTNTMVLGADVIKLLKKRDFALVEEVMIAFIKGDKKRTPDMFINTLTFLFAVGIIEKKGYKIKLTVRKMEQSKLF